MHCKKSCIEDKRQYNEAKCTSQEVLSQCDLKFKKKSRQMHQLLGKIFLYQNKLSAYISSAEATKPQICTLTHLKLDWNKAYSIEKKKLHLMYYLSIVNHAMSTSIWQQKRKVICHFKNNLIENKQKNFWNCTYELCTKKKYRMASI